ncbi:MAG TPA: DoxX family protein [Actinomycetota bacterium]|jgi:putative oxidoreductase|nr:DoxX family protein [Actinomycetota bacterium]
MSAAAGIVVLAGRVLFAVFFGWVAGRAHIRMSPMFEGGARAGGFPVPAVAGWPSGAWLAVAAVSVALGIWPDVGALMVAVWVVIAAAYFHRFWELEDEQQKTMQTQLFWRNALALAAALVMFGSFAAFGPELRFTITAPLFQF